MNLRFLLGLILVLGLASLAEAGNPANPILFVTQVPMPEEVNTRNVSQSYQSCVSPFSNHLADTAHAGRGGSLFIRFTDGAVIDLLNVADWSAIGSKPAADTVAVRNPSVNWTGNKAVFSMVIGAPASAADSTTFVWQLYEITLPTQGQLSSNVKPVITQVANQPAYNNVFPTYGLSGKIIFASDRPYNGQAHLTQREEYLGLPTVSGIWSLDPASATSLQILHHSPSGAFSPQVDSAGRLIFINWDHLSRDSEAVTDSRAGDSVNFNETFAQTFNGSGNFDDESAGANFTQVIAMAANSWDVFPEPRSFDHKTLTQVYNNNINGNAFNIFMPWMINPDGTGGEILNHVGRHELGAFLGRSHPKDPDVIDLNANAAPGYGGMVARNFFSNLLWIHEDPAHPGTFFGSDSADLGTHGAGQIVKLTNAGAGVNPDTMGVVYITPGFSAAKPAQMPTVKPSIDPTITLPFTPSKLANAEMLYRTPVPLSDRNLVASHTLADQTDYNAGTYAAPVSLYAFRLKSLKPSGPSFVPDLDLTTGLTINATYWVGALQVTYNGPAWELDPAEVVARVQPTAAVSSINPIEAGVFATSGVDVATFQKYLVAQNAALSVSRDVTKRDRHDRQQPFNLKVSWSNTQTTGTAGILYNVAWVQFFQGDLRRGYTLGNASPAPGRRVVSTPLHDTINENVATPLGAPAGSVKIGDDGSFAAILPAGKAMTWHLVDNDVAQTSQVKERFWVTFQPGEIRTCANCHGINTSDQAGSLGPPTNPPQALAALLQFWKSNHPSGSVEHAALSANALKTAGSISLSVTRSGGTTGPVQVDYTTVNGTALAGVDFTAPINGKLNWVDGEGGAKTIVIALLNNPIVASDKTFSVVLSNPLFGALGAKTIATVALSEPQPMGPLKIVAERGTSVKGAPSGVIYRALGTPQSGALLGVTQLGRVKTSAIFAEDGSVRVQVGDAPAALSGLVVNKLGPPNGDAAHAILKLQAGSVTAANDSVLLAGLTDGPVRIAAREGIPFANPNDVSIRSFNAFDGRGDVVFFLATLQGNVTSSNNIALCAALANGTVKILVRKGDPLGSSSVETIGCLVGVHNSLAASRWRTSGNSIGVRLVLADGTEILYTIPWSATSSADWTRWIGTDNLPLSAPLANDSVADLGFPGFGEFGPAVVAKLSSSLSLAVDWAVLRADTGGLTVLAHKGDYAPGTGNPGFVFKSFAAPVSGTNKRTAFFGTLAGVPASVGTGIWFSADGSTINLLARAGDPAPGGGKWASFQSLVLPDGSSAGPVFTATLILNRTAGVSHVTAGSNHGLWALDSTGTVIWLLRTGQTVDVNGFPRTLKRFSALAAAPGSIGAGSGYEPGKVAVLATFTDGTVVLLELAIP